MSSGRESDTLVGDSPDARGLFARAPGEGGRDDAYQRRSSGHVRLLPDDLEVDTDFAGPGAGKGWKTRAVIGVLFMLAAVILALGAGNPGPAAGLLPLSLEAIPALLSLASVGAAVGAVIFFMSAVRRGASANAPRSTRLSRRSVFVGTGAYGVQIGDEGLALASTQRRFTARWTGFDAATLYDPGLNPAGLPHLSKAQAGATGLEAVFGPPGDNPAVERVIEEAAAWARRNAFIRLPLKHDRSFAVRAGRKGEERLFPEYAEREYLRLSRRAFESGDGDLSWPGFVAAAVLMIARHDPDWRDELPETDRG
ncbi:MAG: hypothetical protein ACLFQ5_00130 [Oceanicaulis sp.]